jgi:DNA repair exonuclease SbcCD ATPase subunit
MPLLMMPLPSPGTEEIVIGRKIRADASADESQGALEAEEGAQMERQPEIERLTQEVARLCEQHVLELAAIQKETEAALRAKDVETQHKLESDRDRISCEFAEERARADARVREAQEALEVEKGARVERQREIERLTEELERMTQEIERQRLQHVVEIQVEVETALAAKDVETRRTIEDDRNQLSRAVAEERARTDARVDEIQEALEAEKSGRMESQRKIEQMAQEMESQRQQHLAEIRAEVDAALAAKDVEMRRELEDIRADLLRSVEKIEDNRNQLSREFAEDRARADAKMREIQEALETEKDAGMERQREIEQLTQWMEKQRKIERLTQQMEWASTPEERADIQRQLDELRDRNRNMLKMLGRAIDSIFSR